MPSEAEKPDEMMFRCEECGESIILTNAVTEYGVIFVCGKDDGFWGTACPKCQKTNLSRTHLSNIEILKKILSPSSACGKTEESSELRYSSFPYDLSESGKQELCGLKRFIKPIAGGLGRVSKEEIQSFYEENPTARECYHSYSFDDPASGPAIMILWFNMEEVARAVAVENVYGAKVFPRYAYPNPLSDAVERFIWKFDDPTTVCSFEDLTAYPEIGRHKAKGSRSTLSIQRNSEFLGLLKYGLHMLAEPPVPELKDNVFDKILGFLKYRRRELAEPSASGLKGNALHKIESWIAQAIEDFDTERTQDRLSRLSLTFRLTFRSFNNKRFGKEDLHAFFSQHLSELKRVPKKKEYTPFSADEGIYPSSEGTQLHERVIKPSLPGVPPTLEHLARVLAVGKNAPEHTDGGSPKDQSELHKRFPSMERIVTINPDLTQVKFKVAEISVFDTDILVLGETGTGKELFARAIHDSSGYSRGPFISVNCASIPNGLFESELFGHTKGAFSNAYYDKPGAFESANHGTLFLDEIGELPLEFQAKLLRAVEYRTINRVGSVKPINLRMKIVFATNLDLKEEAEKKRFRKDLFYRIFSPSFRIIPLRERVEDIPVLADHFIQTFNAKFGKKVTSVDPSLLNAFRKYAWEGNVRELMKVIEMGVINTQGSLISEQDVPYFSSLSDTPVSTEPQDGIPPATKITDDEIRYWMEKLNFNKTQVANRLGVCYRTILRRSAYIFSDSPA